MDWAREKTFESIVKNNKNKFDHGTVLYVENADKKTKLESFGWHKAMMNSKDLFKLHINLTELQPDNQDSTIVVQVPKNATLRRLKDKISKKIGVPTTEFGLKRNYVSSELKELDHSMLQHGITNNSILKVLPGMSNPVGVYEIQITHIKILQQSPEVELDGTNKTKGETFFSKKPLGKIKVNGSKSLSQFRAQIYQELVSNDEDLSGLYTSEYDIKIRDPKNEDLGEVIHVDYEPDQEVCFCHLYDGKEFLIQKVK